MKAILTLEDDPEKTDGELKGVKVSVEFDPPMNGSELMGTVAPSAIMALACLEFMAEKAEVKEPLEVEKENPDRVGGEKTLYALILRERRLLTDDKKLRDSTPVGSQRREYMDGVVHTRRQCLDELEKLQDYHTPAHYRQKGTVL